MVVKAIFWLPILLMSGSCEFFCFSQKSGIYKESFLGLPLVWCIIFEETNTKHQLERANTEYHRTSFTLIANMANMANMDWYIISFYSSSWYGRFLDQCFISSLSGISFLPHPIQVPIVTFEPYCVPQKSWTHHPRGKEKESLYTWTGWTTAQHWIWNTKALKCRLKAHNNITCKRCDIVAPEAEHQWNTSK